jgi:hypothetical protein
MPAFESLVDLCRLADDSTVAGTDLVLRLSRTSQSVALIEAIESGGWDTTLRVDSVVFVERPDRLAEGRSFELIVHGMARTNEVVANNVGMLLRYNFGSFLGRPPSKYYLLQERYASWEVSHHADVQAYQRALRVLKLMRRLADVVREREQSAEEAIFLTTRKLSMPLVYDSSVLSTVASDGEIDRFEAVVFDEHHRAARLDIAKRVLVRFFDTVAEDDRFADLLKRLPQASQAVLADFDLFASGFSFDKAREEFERKKLDFLVKINAAGSDAMNKLIAIPIGQGLLASQMKVDAAYIFINWTLLSASAIFAVISAMLLASYVLTLRQVGTELGAEKRLLEERAPPTYGQLKPMISELERRIRLHVWGVPIVLGSLLAVTTVLTFLAFDKLTP